MSCNKLERYSLLFTNNRLTGALEYFDVDGNAVLPPNEYSYPGTAPDGFATWAEYLEALNDCSCLPPDCRESQEWTFGIDNTGTRFSETFTIRFTLSDGTSFDIQQTPTAGWSQQLQQWDALVEAQALLLGLPWFVESRFLLPSNPTSTAGGGGLPGPPSPALGQALYNGGMRWRYLNIQVCPGAPTPARAEIIDGPRKGQVLVSAGAIKGELKRFEVCKKKCGGPEDWFIREGKDLRPALPAECPNCWEPCGTYALAPEPPSQQCLFETTDGCDNVNSTDPSDWVNIVRSVNICEGISSARYYIIDPTDPTALIDYNNENGPIGTFVDCASGIEVPEPVDPDAQVDWIHACLTDGTDFQPGFYQYYVVGGSQTGEVRDQLFNALPKGWTIAEDQCECSACCDCEDCTEELFLLISKYELTTISSEFPGAVQVGDVTGGTHPEGLTWD